jgi:hypothetical protein
MLDLLLKGDLLNLTDKLGHKLVCRIQKNTLD